MKNKQFSKSSPYHVLPDSTCLYNPDCAIQSGNLWTTDLKSCQDSIKGLKKLNRVWQYMTGYTNFEGKVCRLIIRERSSFFVLNPDKSPILSNRLRQYIWKEIDFWQLLNTCGSFDLIYTIENRNDPGARFIRHTHEFTRIKSELRMIRQWGIWIFAKYCRQMESFHQCSICGIVYKMILRSNAAEKK